MTTPRKIDLTHARRLIISKQHLDAAERPPMLDVIKDLGCVQLDPISRVARTHRLVLHSRLGKYDEAELERLRWEECSVFEYWAHAASIVCTDDYPIHAVYMQHKRLSEKSQQWLKDNDLGALRQHILQRITDEGALPSRDFSDDSRTDEHFSGWTSNRSVSRLFQYLWTGGELMVSGRQGNQRIWELKNRFFPEWTPRDRLTKREASKRAIERAVKALGVARGRKQINYHFTRNRYWEIAELLPELIAEGVLIPVDMGDGRNEWMMHRDDLDTLKRIESGDWQGKTVLLSPFDNLICDRDRTEDLFDFYFRIEIYVPKDKREFGYYVLPILYGDSLIGRMDMEFDKKKKVLHVNSTYAEDDAPDNAVGEIRSAVESLGDFLGARDIAYGDTLPAMWSALKK